MKDLVGTSSLGTKIVKLHGRYRNFGAEMRTKMAAFDLRPE